MAHTTTSSILTGRAAVAWADRHGVGVNCHADPIDEAATGIDPHSERVAEAIEADPGLVWVDSSPARNGAPTSPTTPATSPAPS